MQPFILVRVELEIEMKIEMENRDRASHLIKVVELEHVRPSL